MSPETSPSPSPSSASLEVTWTVTVGDASIASLTLTVGVMATSLWFGGHSVSGTPDTEIVGAAVSETVTVKLHDAEFPASSVAVQWTVVAPIGNSAPDAGEHERVGLGSMSSVAVTV